MENARNFIIDRKIQANSWILKAKWFYIISLSIVGFIVEAMGFFDFPYITNIIFTGAGVLMNIFLYLLLKNVETNYSYVKLMILSYLQVIFELVVFTLILYVSGTLEGVTFMFYFLPIITSSMIFGPKGSMTVALITASSISALVYMEFNHIIPHISPFGIDSIKYKHAQIAMTDVLSIALFYVIAGFYSGIASKLILNRERILEIQSNKLRKEKDYRENEFKQLEKTTKLLVRRDLELRNSNNELDRKIQEVEKSEKSMIKAFQDLKIERKKLEHERKKTDAIISNFIDPIIVVDKEGKIIILNPAAKNVFLFADEDLGKTVEKKNNYSMNNFKDIARNEFVVKSGKDFDIYNPNEEEVTINFVGQDISYRVVTAEVIDRESSESFGVMKIFNDLTREKMLDKLKSEFISIAAHQLRTPLSAIKWSIKMVLDGDEGKLNPDQEKLLFKGYQSNERIIKLVNDMLNVSRIEEGRFGYKKENNSFVKLVDDELSDIENLVAEKRIKVVYNKEEDVPDVLMDPQKMSLVVQNLIENAVKYTPEHGKIEVTVSKADDFVHFLVKDNGVGIPKEDQVKLFKKFFRATNVVRMETEGSGLGLFIVYNIIKEHGGEILCNSEEGMGTEFVVILPINNKKE